MSGRGEPRGGAGAVGGATSHRGDTAEAGGTEGSGGRPRNRPEPRIPPPAARRSSTTPLRQVLNWGGGCPGVPPAPLWACSEAPLALRPRVPAHLPSRCDAQLCRTQRSHRGPPPAFFRGDSAQGVAGKRHSIWLRSVPPPQSILQGPYPLQKGLGHLYVPLPRKRGNHPKKNPLPAGLAWLGAALLREGAGLQRWGLQGLGGLFSPPHAATSLPGSS